MGSNIDTAFQYGKTMTCFTLLVYDDNDEDDETSSLRVSCFSTFPQEPYINHPFPSISFAMTIMNFHMYSLSGQTKFSINPSLKHLLYTIVKFIKDHLP